MVRLFVGNIPHSSQEEDLRFWFEQHGHRVQACEIIRDRLTGYSRGFAFVELGDTSDMEGAIERLNGLRLRGRVLTVGPATPKASHAHVHTA